MFNSNHLKHFPTYCVSVQDVPSPPPTPIPIPSFLTQAQKYNSRQPPGSAQLAASLLYWKLSAFRMCSTNPKRGESPRRQSFLCMCLCLAAGISDGKERSGVQLENVDVRKMCAQTDRQGKNRSYMQGRVFSQTDIQHAHVCGVIIRADLQRIQRRECCSLLDHWVTHHWWSQRGAPGTPRAFPRESQRVSPPFHSKGPGGEVTHSRSLSLCALNHSL